MYAAVLDPCRSFVTRHRRRICSEYAAVPIPRFSSWGGVLCALQSYTESTGCNIRSIAYYLICDRQKEEAYDKIGFFFYSSSESVMGSLGGRPRRFSVVPAKGLALIALSIPALLTWV